MTTVADRRALEGRALARMELERREREARWTDGSDGLWCWLAQNVETEDPLERAFRPFPADADWAQYLRVLAALYCNPDAHLVLVRKSRRMLASWFSIAARVWKAGKFKHENIFFGARKLGLNINEGSLEMVKRATQILARLKVDRIRYEAFRDHIEFPDTGSRIVAVPQGPDALRGVSATDLLMDEAAFWEEAEESFTAARPTIEGRGKIWIVSSVYPGWFWDFSNDRTGHARGSESLPSPRVASPMQGVTVRENPGNGATVVDLHYTADHRKRTAAWKDAEQRGMSPHGWRREYEMEGDQFSGLPVLEGAYDDATMAKPAPLAVDYKRPMIRGWDWGFTHPCCVVGQFFDSRQLRIYRAWLGSYTDLEPFASQVLRRCRELWPGKPFQDCGDFAGNQRKGTGPPEVDLLQAKFGLTVMTRYMLEDEPLTWLRQDLMRTLYRPGEPNFQVEVNEDTEDFRKALRGGWHLDGKGKPANDGLYEHYGDALKSFKNFEFEGTPYLRDMERMASAEIVPEKADWL